MDSRFDFNDLVVFDLANNHQGSVEHGLNVIRGVGETAKRHGVRGALKFQFRQLDTFVHPAHKKESDVKHINRFLSTRLEPSDYQILFDEVKRQGLLTMCTPFDEESVDLIVRMGFDILKIASCSASDWPLLEKAADSDLPVVCSIGGLERSQVDDLVSFFKHRGVDFALMYCVSIYPTPSELMNLNMIGIMKERYPDVTIGWSTHEDQDDTMPVAIAYGKGARMFERHVGVENEEVTLNAYSSNPEQMDRWLAALHHARTLCGGDSWRPVVPQEREAMDGLRRGVYAKRPIKAGSTVGRDQVYFAMPYVEGQLPSGSWQEGAVAKAEVKPDAPLLKDALEVPENSDVMVLKEAVHEIKALLNQARISLGPEFGTEYSHHYGISSFRKFGAVIINCINREYCKKIIVQLPGQRHPSHFHKRKEETFQVLYGTMSVNVDGHIRHLQPGDTCLVMPGVWHSFWSDEGCVFEEVSTTHFNDDSFYADKEINHMKRHERKTVVDHWGRFQLEDPSANKAAHEGAEANSE